MQCFIAFTGDIDNWGDFNYAEVGGIWEISVHSSQCCCGPKSALKCKSKNKCNAITIKMPSEYQRVNTLKASGLYSLVYFRL